MSTKDNSFAFRFHKAVQIGPGYEIPTSNKALSQTDRVSTCLSLNESQSRRCQANTWPLIGLLMPGRSVDKNCQVS